MQVRPPATFIDKMKVNFKNIIIADELETTSYIMEYKNNIYNVKPRPSKKMSLQWLKTHVSQMNNNYQLTQTSNFDLVQEYCSAAAYQKSCGKIKSYLQDMSGSYTKQLYKSSKDLPRGWDLSNLPTLLQYVHQDLPIPGVTEPMLYLSTEDTRSRLHVEDFDFASVNLSFPNSAPKVIYDKFKFFINKNL